MGSNDQMQDILADILKNFKAKFVQPVLTENMRLMQAVDELKAQELAGVEELKERVSRLEQKVDEVPLLVLAAIRDAFNQASEEV